MDTSADIKAEQKEIQQAPKVKPVRKPRIHDVPTPQSIPQPNKVENEATHVAKVPKPRAKPKPKVVDVVADVKVDAKPAEVASPKRGRPAKVRKPRSLNDGLKSWNEKVSKYCSEHGVSRKDAMLKLSKSKNTKSETSK